jgi:ferric-dicitrate binding protein FerR (iron transport regulator)
MQNAAIERIWELLSRKLANEITEAELLELQSMLQKHPTEAYSLEILQDLWNSPVKENKQYAEHQYFALIQKMQKMGIETSGFRKENEVLISYEDNHSVKYPHRFFSRKTLVAAVSLIIISTLSLFFFGTHNKETIALVKSSEITTKDGSKTTLVLPDGTKVWVNAGSKLTYDNNYGNKLREVSLLGEAFFDVTKNAEKPFIIHTAKADIKVLGTAFNVRCYPNEKKMETSLLRGRIEVTLKDRPAQKIYLSPNEKLTLFNNPVDTRPISAKMEQKPLAELPQPMISLGHVTVKPIDSSIVETAWTENKLDFRSETFEEVAYKMERWYGVKIDIQDERLKNEHLTGSFETETIEQALLAMQYTTKFRFSINKNLITITK